MNEPQLQMNAADFIVISTTSDRRETLVEISQKLVASRLAACCQISGPILSVYEWQGEVEESDEWTCLIKTLASNFEPISQAILDLHHYDQPQIIALPATAIEQGYGEWIKQQSKPKPEST